MQTVPFSHPAWIEIDLDQFKKNIHILKQHIGDSKLCLPVKANAYGHGLTEIAQAAVSAKVDYLGVACVQEGILLRQANINIPILVFGAFHVDQINSLIDYDLEFSLSSTYKAKLVAEFCEPINKQVKVHLEIDTGMNRTGMRVATANTALEFIRSHPCFDLKGVYSHLATADEPDHKFTAEQIASFVEFVQQHALLDDPNVLCHLANSAGVACHPNAHLDMVRPGLLAFGYYPRHDIPQHLRQIKPCLTIKAKVAYFKTVFAGSGVSYNHTHITSRDTHLLTIPVGYGDGVRRCLSNQGAVLLNGKRYPIVGNVCMDQFMVDIGDDAGFVGDVVTIIGRDQDAEITIEEHSKFCNTISYEILCGFNDRLPRIYKTIDRDDDGGDAGDDGSQNEQYRESSAQSV